MGDEFLAKAKDYSNISVIHSNTNPYAAAAMMGMMRREARRLARIFGFQIVLSRWLMNSFLKNPMLTLLLTKLTTDFKADWLAYLRTTGLPACGLKYEDIRSPEENTIRFLNAFNRRIPAAKQGPFMNQGNFRFLLNIDRTTKRLWLS